MAQITCHHYCFYNRALPDACAFHLGIYSIATGSSGASHTDHHFIYSLGNIMQRRKYENSSVLNRGIIVNYGLAMFLGLTHGMGFANNFKFVLEEEASILKQLFAFNTGLELGQVTVVIIFGPSLYPYKMGPYHPSGMDRFHLRAGAGIDVVMICFVIPRGFHRSYPAFQHSR
jgi:hypothetical protein